MQYRRITTHFMERGKSHCFSLVVAGTWVIFSSYSEDDPSKHVFLQQCQASCLVIKDTSRITSSLGRAIWMLLEVSWETQGPFLVATVILGFL